MRGALARFLALPRLVRVLWILAVLLACDVLLRLT
jgi:hypothetical protein